MNTVDFAIYTLGVFGVALALGYEIGIRSSRASAVKKEIEE